MTHQTDLFPVEDMDLPQVDSFKTKEPRFCVIAPTPYLEQFAAQSTAHLVLAHIVKEDDSYAEFYRDLAHRGDFIIMDNGAFEIGESYDPDQLVELGRKCGAQVLVLPDYPFADAAKTVNAAKKYIPLFKEAGFKTMYVPQSLKGDTEAWIASYQWGAENDDIDVIGMSILGIPGALPHIPAAYARVVMTQILKDRRIFNEEKHHHYLGLQASPSVEVPALIAMNALDTLDSSNPVWSGINGFRYNETSFDMSPTRKKYLRHVDFNQPMVGQHLLDVVQHNLTLTFDVFVNPVLYL